MAEHKKGDWIRVDAQIEDVLTESKAVTVCISLFGRSDPGVKKRFESMRGHSWVIEPPGIHEVPIVPVPDLIEELELRQEWMSGVVHEGTMDRICTLRDAREAAEKPKEGDRVLVYGERTFTGGVRVRVAEGYGSPISFMPHPDDIFNDVPE